MRHSLIARRQVGPQTQWRPRHKAFTSGLRLDAMSLAWPTVVQLVVCFNSGLEWGISQEYSFFVSSQWSIDFVFSLRCIDWVRNPLCEPNVLCIFCFLVFIKNYIGIQVEVCTVKSLFSLRCIDSVRKPLCGPNFLCIFYIKDQMTKF